MRRPRTAVLVTLAAVAFLVVSFELARFLTAASGERDDVYALLIDQARGDVPAMLDRLEGCEADAGCRRLVQANARRLRTAGAPKILSYESGTSYALSTKTAPARVAWAVISEDGDATVQCVTVRRSWSFVHGASVSLRRVSAPIDPEAGC